MPGGKGRRNGLKIRVLYGVSVRVRWCSSGIVKVGITMVFETIIIGSNPITLIIPLV